MKKILVILACVAMLFSFASCDNNNGGAASDYLNKVQVAGDVVKAVAGEFATAFAESSNLSVPADNTLVVTIAADEIDAVGANDASLSGEVILTFVKSGDKNPESAEISAKDLVLVDGYNEYPIAVSGKLPFNVTAFTATAAKTEPSTPASATLTATLGTPSAADISFSVGGTGVSSADVFKAAEIATTEIVAEDNAKIQEYVNAVIAAITGDTATAKYTTADTVITVTAANAIGTASAELVLTGTTDSTTFTVTSAAFKDITVEEGSLALSGLTKVTVTPATITVTASTVDTAVTIDDLAVAIEGTLTLGEGSVTYPITQD